MSKKVQLRELGELYMSFSKALDYRKLLLKNSKGHYLDDESIRKLQKCLVTILDEILVVCKKYDIKPMLVGGCLIGYVRHNGRFIPWDDDIDIGMTREDYEKFIEIFDKELSDKFILSVPRKEYDTYQRFMQIYRKETILDEGNNPLGGGHPPYIYIDVFPFDYVSENRIIRTIKGQQVDLLMAVGGFVNTYYHMNEESRQIFKASHNGKIYYALRMIVGKIFSWRTPKQWYEQIDKTVKNTKRTGYITSALGRGHYFGEMNPTDVILPMKMGKFEGLDIYIPNNTDAFLRNLYGDYMQIPPVESRERHFAVEVKTLDETL